MITLAAALLMGCGERTKLPNNQDGAPPQDSLVPQKDGGGPKKDACAYPANGCHSNADCKQGHECVGCGADPCCPMCAVCYGSCQPKTPGACSSSKDCLEGSYCHFDNGSCGKHAGMCKPRPSGCYALYKPVCGCDGKTYGNDCMAWSKGISIAYLGACSAKKCQDLFNDYKAAVAKAKICCPMCNSIQCQKKVKHQLVCGCNTYVQITNTAQLQLMDQLKKDWTNLDCAKSWACPGVACPAVNGASCVPDAVGSGTCKDLSTTPP